jgi:hypothetical protein
MTTYRLPIAIEYALPNWPFVDFRKEGLRRGGSVPTTIEQSLYEDQEVMSSTIQSLIFRIGDLVEFSSIS